MDLNIKKDKRSNHHSKQPYGIGSTAVKEIAFKDIVKDCGKDKFFTRNYIQIESIVLTACSCVLTVYPIDTTIY